MTELPASPPIDGLLIRRGEGEPASDPGLGAGSPVPRGKIVPSYRLRKKLMMNSAVYHTVRMPWLAEVRKR